MIIDQLNPLILASTSPRRQNLLKEAGFIFTVLNPDVVEDENPLANPAELVQNNAALKARAVSALYPESWVIGADTTVALDNRLFNKPQDEAEARWMLQTLSGKVHTVYTGVHFVNIARKIDQTFLETAQVTFKVLTDSMIESYMKKVSVLDKAGAYGIQEYPDMIISHFTGLRSTIMGLPIERFNQWLNTVIVKNASS
jgi:septum formation protein